MAFCREIFDAWIVETEKQKVNKNSAVFILFF